MRRSVTLSPGAHLFACTEPLPLEHGGVVDPLLLAYELVGPRLAPVVVVQGGISSGRHLGFWEELVGPGRAIDTRRLRVLSLDFVVADGVTSHDQARATARLLDGLGVERVRSFVGASYGGMVGLAFAALYPERLDRLVAISAPARPHPTATAWRSVQRRIVALGLERDCADEAVAIARALGMVTYRGDEELRHRFDAPPERRDGSFRFPVEGYLLAHGRGFSERLPAPSYLALSLAIDLHRVDPAGIRVPSIVAGARTDRLVPFSQLEELAQALGGPSRLVEIDSIRGHDAFLTEPGAVAAILQEVAA